VTPHDRRHRRPQAHRPRVGEAALLKACRAPQTTHLAAIVNVALETGMRYGEIMGLTWGRVDRARVVLMHERTKSGKRRDVPMRPEVDAVFAAMPEPRQGRVWPDKRIRTAFENAVESARAKGLYLPRVPPSLRVPAHHAGRPARIPPADPRPPGYQDDPPLRAPLTGPPARGDEQDRGRGRK
jgi:integrase